MYNGNWYTPFDLVSWTLVSSLLRFIRMYNIKCSVCHSQLGCFCRVFKLKMSSPYLYLNPLLRFWLQYFFYIRYCLCHLNCVTGAMVLNPPGDHLLIQDLSLIECSESLPLNFDLGLVVHFHLTYLDSFWRDSKIITIILYDTFQSIPGKM